MLVTCLASIIRMLNIYPATCVRFRVDKPALLAQIEATQ